MPGGLSAIDRLKKVPFFEVILIVRSSHSRSQSYEQPITGQWGNGKCIRSGLFKMQVVRTGNGR